MSDQTAAERVAWDPGYDQAWRDQSDPPLRYPNWRVIDGVEDPEACYSFHYIAAFYDPDGKCYRVGETSGCSCPSPWEEHTAELSPPMNRQEAAQEFVRRCGAAYVHFRPEDVVRVVDAVRGHEAQS